MPSRTRRTATTGLLWEALVPAVRWPLHSPRRLAVLLAALVVLIWLFGTLRPTAAADPGPASTMNPTPLPSSSVSNTMPSSMVPPVAPVTSSTPPPGPAPASAGSAEVATRFVTAWARPDLPVQQWQADLIPLATADFAAQLRTVFPANVPARSVSGQATVGSVSELAASVTVPTDAGPVLVQLAVIRDTWRVSATDPGWRGPCPQ